MSFNETLAHLMLAKGSVALSTKRDNWREHETKPNLGSYYASFVEGDLLATKALFQRLQNGATIVYDKCGPSDFGQESRFADTFADEELQVYYAIYPIVLSDSDIPIVLVADADPDRNFVNLLEALENNSFEYGFDQLKKRIESTEVMHASRSGNYATTRDYAITMPKLYSKDI